MVIVAANKDEVMPIVTCTDTNYDKEQVSITVRGANSGEVITGTVVSNVNLSEKFFFALLPAISTQLTKNS